MFGDQLVPAERPLAACCHSPLRSELALLPTDNDFLKVHALITAMVVRNAMEDFHCQHLSDEQMRQLSPTPATTLSR